MKYYWNAVKSLSLTYTAHKKSRLVPNGRKNAEVKYN